MKKNRLLLVLVFCLLMSIVHASTDNIAPLAKITSSSSLSKLYDEKNIADGIVDIDGFGEWACKGDTSYWGYVKFPWIQLSWDEAQWVDKVVLFDRVNLHDNIASVKMTFSDGSVEWVHQIPGDGTGVAVKFSARKTKWIKLEVNDGTGKDLGFSEVQVFSSIQGAKDYVAMVNPYIETNKGRYEFFITGSLPFGMATSAPLTRNKHQYGGGYNYNERAILGFQQIHAWMLSGIEIMPATDQENPLGGRDSWKSPFNHDDEIVQPGYQKVMLQKNKIWVEQTATDRVNFYRFQYTRPSNARIIIDMGSTVKNCSTMEDAQIKKVNNTEIEGSFHTTNRLWGGPKDVPVFFVIQFDKPFKSLDSWQGSASTKSNIEGGSGDSLKLGASYRMNAGDKVQMKIAISYTSVKNARANLKAECNHWRFDEVRNNARKIWNDHLGKIDIKGGSPEQREKFYTDLWHVLLGRQKISDVSGDYPDRTEITSLGGDNGNFSDAVFKVKSVPKDRQGKPKFNMYLSDAFWLTQWNINILWGLAWPEMMDEFSACLLEYAKNGKLLPRGPMAGGYTFIMTGDPAASFIVSTYMRGLLKKSDPDLAFEVIKRNQMPGGMLGGGEPGKDASEFYASKGWWPSNAGITLEAAFQDWGAGQMASKLGRKADYQYFNKRSAAWLNCFDTSTKFIFPKDKDGKFTHKDPLSGAGWVEANAWQATWSVSHDITKLVQLMGGSDSFCNKLNHAFEKSKNNHFVDDYGSGYISYGNQPGCSNAHLFSYGGKPWLTQYWVRQVKQQTYGGTTPDMGYGGHDEDEGQMGGIKCPYGYWPF